MLSLVLLIFPSSKIPELAIKFDDPDRDGSGLVGIVSHALAEPIKISIANRCSTTQIHALNNCLAHINHKNLKSISMVCEDRSTFDELCKCHPLVHKIRCLSLAFSVEPEDLAVKKFDKFPNLDKLCICYTTMNNLKNMKDILIALEKHLTRKDKKPLLERYGIFSYLDVDQIKIAPDLLDLDMIFQKDKQTLSVKTSAVRVSLLSKALMLERHKNVTNLVLTEPCDYEIMKKILDIKSQGYLSTISHLSIICKDSYVYNMLIKSQTLSSKIRCLTLDYVNKTPFSEPKHPTELLNMPKLRILKLQMDQAPQHLPKCQAMYQLCNHVVQKRGYIQISSPNHFDGKDIFFWTQRLPENDSLTELSACKPDYKIVSNILEVDIRNKHTWRELLLDMLHQYPLVQHIDFVGSCDQETIQFLNFFAERKHFNHIQDITLECANHEVFKTLAQSCEELRGKIIQLTITQPLQKEAALYDQTHKTFEKFNVLLRLYIKESHMETIEILKSALLEILEKRNKHYQHHGIFILDQNNHLINSYA